MTTTRRHLLLGTVGIVGAAAIPGCTDKAASAAGPAASPSTTAAAADSSIPAASSSVAAADTPSSASAVAARSTSAGPELLTGAAATLPTPAIPTSKTPRLSSIPNFRDLAGGTRSYRGTGGRQMQTGVFYRSNALTLTAADSATITKLGITQIYDLRMPSQITQTPDVVPSGAHWQNVSIFGTKLTLPQITSNSQVPDHMSLMYQAMVKDGTCQQKMAALLTDMASASGPVLFHCSQGKDRTGWTAAVLHGIAGVSPADTMTNFLLTNSYTAADIQHETDKYAAEYGDAIATDFLPVFGVDAAMLQASLDVLNSTFGGLHSWLTTTLGLSDTVISRLEEKLLA